MTGLVLGVFIVGVVITIVLRFYSYYCSCYDRPQYDSAPPWSIIWTQSYYYDSFLSYCPSDLHSSSYSAATNSAAPWRQIFSSSDDNGTLTFLNDDVIIPHSTTNVGLIFLYWTSHHKIGSICCRRCWSCFVIVIAFSLWY